MARDQNDAFEGLLTAVRSVEKRQNCWRVVAGLRESVRNFQGMTLALPDLEGS